MSGGIFNNAGGDIISQTLVQKQYFTDGKSSLKSHLSLSNLNLSAQIRKIESSLSC
jgi:hypothetical protein